MSLFRAAIVAGAALAISGWGPVRAAGPLDAFKLGFWSGGAYTDDRTGSFTHCSAGVAYDSGINMFILVTPDYSWWLGFIDPHWSFPFGRKLPVALRLGQEAPVASSATVPSGQLLLVPLPQSSDAIEALRHTSRLTLVAEGRSFRFELGATSAVLGELIRCVQRGKALATRGSPSLSSGVAAASLETKPTQDGALAEKPTQGGPAPFAPDTAATGQADVPATAAAAPPPPALQAARELPANPIAAPSPGNPVSTAAVALVLPKTGAAAATAPAVRLPQMVVTQPAALEEIHLARDFFTTAKLPNARLVAADKPAALTGFAAVWRSDHNAGAVRIIPAGPDVSGIGIASNLIAVDPQMCRGNFATARSTDTFSGGVVFSALLSCTEADERRSAQYFVVPRRQGGFVVFAVVGSGDAGDAIGARRQRIDLLARAAFRAAQETAAEHRAQSARIHGGRHFGREVKR